MIPFFQLQKKQRPSASPDTTMLHSTSVDSEVSLEHGSEAKAKAREMVTHFPSGENPRPMA